MIWPGLGRSVWQCVNTLMALFSNMVFWEVPEGRYNRDCIRLASILSRARHQGARGAALSPNSNCNLCPVTNGASRLRAGEVNKKVAANSSFSTRSLGTRSLGTLGNRHAPQHESDKTDRSEQPQNRFAKRARSSTPPCDLLKVIPKGGY